MSDSPQPEMAPNATPDVGERVRLMRDGLINNSSLLVSALVGIILVPIMVRGLGAEAYGLWMAALALGGLVGNLDFGLGATATRVVAAEEEGETHAEAPTFVATGWNAYLGLSLAGALLIAIFGLPLSRGLQLQPATRVIAPLVFCLAGLNFFGTQLLMFITAVLQGLRRFDVANLIATASVLVSGVGVVVLLSVGGGVVQVAGWLTLATVTTVTAAVVIVHKLKPHLRFSLGVWNWHSLRPHLSFGFWSQLTTVVDNVCRSAGTLLIGLLLGSVAITPFAVGQKFPLGVSSFQLRATDVLFPAASRAERSGQLRVTQEIIEVGTRWILVLMLPVYLVLWLVGPNLLLAWVGVGQGDELFILRLTCVAMAVAAVGTGASQVLWGHGEARKVFLVDFTAAALNVVVSLALILRIGLKGAAWGFAVSASFLSIAYIGLSSALFRIKFLGLLRTSLRGLLLPAIACAAITLAVLHVGWPGRWTKIAVASSLGGLAYGTVFYFFGARREERMLVRQVLGLPISLARSAWQPVRRALRDIGFLHRQWRLFLGVKRALFTDPERIRAKIDGDFAREEDPYECASSEEQERFRRELAMLDAARGTVLFERALEIGCAEGTFTEQLAPRCRALFAHDFAPRAVARAKERCQRFAFVGVEEGNMLRDPLPSDLDLVVIVGVLGYLYRPRDFRLMRAKIVDALRPRGHLLVGEVRGEELYERVWWGRHLLIGGKNILAFFGEHPELRLVASSSVEPWMHALFQKV